MRLGRWLRTVHSKGACTYSWAEIAWVAGLAATRWLAGILGWERGHQRRVRRIFPNSSGERSGRQNRDGGKGRRTGMSRREGLPSWASGGLASQLAVASVRLEFSRSSASGLGGQ